MDNLLTVQLEDIWNHKRLDIVVVRLFDEIQSRSFASKLIHNGLIKVNQQIQKSSYKLSKGDIITLDISFLKEKNAVPIGEKIPLQILYEDEDILVLDKVSGMVVHPGAGVSSGTLVNAVLAHCGHTLPSLGEAHRAGIVHRLDRDTTGVIIVAKSQLALTELSKQFANHSQQRIYHTLVYKPFSILTGSIETWHGRDPKNRLKYAVQPIEIGKYARLNYQVLKQNDLFALVECTLHTGRTHQIRVQLESIGHNIVGDALYGQITSQVKNNKINFCFIQKQIYRQLLHACILEIIHPRSQKIMRFESSYPADFQEALSTLLP